MFANRRAAGRLLADSVADVLAAHDLDPVVVGLPRGGVPVAHEVARALGAPLDVVLVRKIGVPHQPELAMGAIGEHGLVVASDDVVRAAGVSEVQFAAMEERARDELASQASRFREGRPAAELAGCVVVIVDDGVATGATARAACEYVRSQHPRRVVLATPVAPRDWSERLGAAADDYVALVTPSDFDAVGRFYDDFSATTDREVVECLRPPPQQR